MTLCYIDGHEAVPTLRDSIRLTRENPYIKDRDAYTYDITFPLDIFANRRIFGALGRIDTTKRTRKFDDCMLVTDNITVIRGVGTVTTITRDEVKLQILAGASSVHYRADFDSIYIDRIAYPAVSPTYSRGYVNGTTGRKADLFDVTAEIADKGYVGVAGQYVFMPVWDDSHDHMANRIAYDGDGRQYMQQLAVQPNFMLVLRTVLRHMGYTVTANVYDTAPWNSLYVCSAHQTTRMAGALPHWTVATFIDEVRRLFNATFIFDENDKTVRILRADSMADMPTVAYEAAEDMECSYNEDALEYLPMSNLRYKLSGLGNRIEELPPEVLASFERRQYESVEAMMQAFNGMTEKEKLTTLMVTPRGFYYGIEHHDEEGTVTSIGITFGGQFTQLTRQADSDSCVELSICPVAMSDETRPFSRYEYLGNMFHEVTQDWHNVFMPVIDNSAADVADDSERPYVTIEEVIDGASADREQTEETATMQLLWPCGRAEVRENGELKIPLSYTDWRMTSGQSGASMALTLSQGHPYIGQFHERSMDIDTGSAADGNNEVRIPFLCDGMPDPTLIYTFQGKRFLCSKIEANITENGIDRLKNGYFYELL